MLQESSYLFASKESISQELGNSFAPNIRIKEEPLDDEYDKAMAPQGLLDKIKDEPDNSEVSLPLLFIFCFPTSSPVNWIWIKSCTWLLIEA